MVVRPGNCDTDVAMTEQPAMNVRLSRQDRLALGVASRVSGRLGASVAVVRVAFALLGLAVGWGVVAYLGLAALLHGRNEPSPRPVTLTRNLGIVVLTAAQLLVVEDLFAAFPAMLLWPVGLVLFAIVLADPDLDADPTRRQSMVGRVVAGVVLMIAGLLTALAGTDDLASLWRAGVAAFVLVGGIGLVLAPWLRRVLTVADTDRADRIRAEERADIAAHLHDSVLQTLTLIQNRAGDPQLTAALAHQQERELRRWLYGADDQPDRTVSFRAALERVAADVEDQYLKIIECIVVGDTANDGEGLGPGPLAVIGAAREAIVNAAKFADIPMISVYAEVDEDSFLVFVRDRGVGFELASVSDDRHGVSDSILGRVERFGGDATIKTSPGNGTEVRIELPR